jgi:hypothetical protein
MIADPKPPKRVKDKAALERFRIQNMGEPCEVCERRPGTDPHHIQFRSQGGGDVAWNLLWLCRACHDDIHAGRSDRYRFG